MKANDFGIVGQGAWPENPITPSGSPIGNPAIRIIRSIEESSNRRDYEAMWAILREPCHPETYLELGESFAPMRGLVGRLVQRPYAGDVFAFTSLASFVLTSAPSYREIEGHDRIAIDFDPELGLFTVRYCEWVSPTRNPSYREAAFRSCGRPEVVKVIDLYVLRMILIRRSR